MLFWINLVLESKDIVVLMVLEAMYAFDLLKTQCFMDECCSNLLF